MQENMTISFPNKTDFVKDNTSLESSLENNSQIDVNGLDDSNSGVIFSDASINETINDSLDQSLEVQPYEPNAVIKISNPSSQQKASSSIIPQSVSASVTTSNKELDSVTGMSNSNSYEIKPGEFLSTIALRELGNEDLWREFVDENGQTFTEESAKLIQPGQIVYLPDNKTTDTVTSDSNSLPFTANNQTIVEALREAIIGQESNYNYKAVNQDSGALGFAQVMPLNIPSWSQEALGYEISADKFLNNPNLQLQIIDYKLNQYYQQAIIDSNGNRDIAVQRVASAWYSGDPNLYTLTNPQYYNGAEYPSIANYTQSVLDKFNEAYEDKDLEIATLSPENVDNSNKSEISNPIPSTPNPENLIVKDAPDSYSDLFKTEFEKEKELLNEDYRNMVLESASEVASEGLENILFSSPITYFTDIIPRYEIDDIFTSTTWDYAEKYGDEGAKRLLDDHEDFLLKAADHYGIDGRAIAGVIRWEYEQNYPSRRLDLYSYGLAKNDKSFLSGTGWGKMHFDTAENILKEEGKYPSKSELADILALAPSAIDMIAKEMQRAVKAYEPYTDIHDDPAILATIYNIGLENVTPNSNPKVQSGKIDVNDFPFLEDKVEEMGLWVSNNLDELEPYKTV